MTPLQSLQIENDELQDKNWYLHHATIDSYVTVGEDVKRFRRECEDKVYKLAREEGRNIGALRQWLNERTETRLITNEDIETFLNL